MSSKLRRVLPVAVLGLVLGACSDKESGNATPGDTSTETTKGSPASTSSGIGDVNACSLLKSEDVSKLKLTPARTLGNSKCEWRTPERMLVGLTIHADKGLKDYVLGPNAQISDVKIGARAAKFIQKALTDTACVYVIEVTSTSRVDVFATGPSLDGSCAAAKSVAEAVEPNLP